VSVKVSTNANKVFNQLEKKVNDALSPKAVDALMRELAVTTAATMRERIHEEGKAANGANIGIYSEEYMKVRKKNNRTGDKKVILSLTRQMEADFTLGVNNSEPTKLPNGYGVGWKNQLNADKAGYLEIKYKKKIFAMTTKERADAARIVDAFVKSHIGKI